jgi:hypothetical protein
LTRREVDPSRLGITGQSGGGTQAAYIFAFDKRIKAGAPVNFITGFRRLLESIGPQDGEQNFYHGILNGITHADLLEVRAPNPALICAGTRDFFSIQGARETYAEVKNAYAAFQAGDNVGLVEDDWAHGLTPVLREGIYAFFQKHLDLPGNPKEEEVVIMKPDELRVTRTGQVATSFENPETVFTINKKDTEKLIDRLEESRKNMGPHLKDVRSNAELLSGYRSPAGDKKAVFRGRYPRGSYSVEMYGLQGEGQYIIPLLLFIPKEGSRFSSVVYLNPNGKNDDAAVGGKIEELVKMGYVVAAPDLIGTGETQGTDASNVAMLIGRSLTGVQAGDISRVVNFLKSRQEVDADRICAVALNGMGPVLVHAAALDQSIKAISLIGCPVSYGSMALNQFYDMDLFDNAVAGALTVYDLPDLEGSLAPRRVALVGLRDQTGKPASDGVVDKELLFPKSVYSNLKASENIRILPATESLSAVVAWSLE